MIIPMKHVTVIFSAQHRRRALMRLRALGVLHIEKKEEESSEISSKIHTRFNDCKLALQTLHHYRKAYRHTITRASRRADAETQERSTNDSDKSPAERAPRARERGEATHRSVGEEVARTVAGIARRMEALREEGERIAHYIDDLRPWGSFKWRAIEYLQEKGFYCHFYTLRKKEFMRNAPARAMVVSRHLGKIYFVAITRSEHNELDYEETPPPAHDLDLLQSREAEIVEELATLEAEVVLHVGGAAAVRTAYERLYHLNQIISARNAFHWGIEGRIALLCGFVPLTHIKELKAQAAEMGWGLFIRDPAEEEMPPTAIANPKSIAIINPIYRLLGTLPGYREPETSIIFLIFFVVFFAMIVGDAGYALLLLLCALCYRLVARDRRQKEGAALLIATGGATLMWGALSGNWFGQETIAQLPLVSFFVIPELDAFNARSIPFVQWICFMIATLHMSIAHIWRMIYEWKYRSWMQSLVNLGWMLLIFGMYAIAVRLILGAFGFWYPSNFLWTIIGGVAIIALFEKQEAGRSFLLGVAKGIGGLFNTLLSGVSLFADVISYLRLFAVGLASVEIARSFNQLAFSVDAGVFSVAISIIILIIGHSLNIAMGMLSIIVHGIRLNMLEFSGHLGVEWSGTPYEPFSEKVAVPNA